MTLLLVYLLGALTISFICSVLEAVLMSTPISYITMREEEGFKPAKLFKKYKVDNASPIAAILSLNTIAHTVGSAGVGAEATALFGSEWFGLISAITTLLILILSEILPKTIGTTYWKRLMGVTAYTIRVMIWMLYPLVLMVDYIGKLISKHNDELAVSREEVAAMAAVGETEGVIDRGESKIIQNVIRLNQVKASDVMTPRVVAAVAPENITLREFYKRDDCSHFSRIPVYADSQEFITGYILRSDALEELAEDNFDKKLSEIKRNIPMYNEDMSVSDIWESLLNRKEQIAGVIDEYGCFMGILTLEDIIETIFGLEIIDENDEVQDMQQYARERWLLRQRKFQELELPQ